MKTLEAIKKQLIQLREHPEPDEMVYSEAADLLRAANTLAINDGIIIESVGKVCSTDFAIATVSRYINQRRPEYLTVPEASRLLGVSHNKISEWIRDGRLDANNVAGKGKRASYRIHRDALRNLKPEAAKPRRYKPPQEII